MIKEELMKKGFGLGGMLSSSPTCPMPKIRCRVKKTLTDDERIRVMNKKELLKSISFGSEVAEDEVRQLASYFVQTNQWTQIQDGKIDIIRGEKGAGKSAIYLLLTQKEDEFFDKGILLVNGEQPRGATVFRDLLTDPPTSEEEFKWLWKIYILTIIAQRLKHYSVGGASASKLYGALEEAKLLEPSLNLQGLLRMTQRFVRKLMNVELQAGIELEKTTLEPSAFISKITFKEPSSDLRSKGFNSVDTLYHYANNALEEHDYKIWVLLDRLDVAFSDNHSLEENALRALFKVYNDFKSFDQISLKIFIREDIWNRSFSSGFREASHINDYVILSWDDTSLLNLIIRRILSNQTILDAFGIDASAVLADSNLQTALFQRLFPLQVEQGKQKSPTLKWIISRCADGKDKSAPREVIHLLKSIKEQELQRLENGGAPAQGDNLFDRNIFKPSLGPVSSTRLTRYLYAEYPEQKSFISKLEGEKTEQTIDTLSRIWNILPEEALKKAEELKEIGFFQRRGTREKPSYWVPFLYRDSLGLKQGKELDIN